MSKQMRPNLSMFGWYILVMNLTLGADIGYSSGKNSSNLKTPPSNGDYNNNNIITKTIKVHELINNSFFLV